MKKIDKNISEKEKTLLEFRQIPGVLKTFGILV